MRSDQLRREITAVDMVADTALREAVTRTWLAALDRGGYRSLAEVPQSAAVPERSLLNHVNEVNALAVDLLRMAETTFHLTPDRDTTIAAAILHDVDKAFIQRLMPSGVVEYVDGYTVRDHGRVGAALALACGVSENVAELIRTHAPFNYDGHLPGTVEGTVVHYADLAAADLAAVQAGAVPIHARSLILKKDHPLLRNAEVIDAY
jgi:putative nucleotidyltransferase with HDIG domain